MCNYLVKSKELSTKVECQKKMYKDGLCWKHYKKKVLKTKNWDERDDFRSATWEDFYDGVPLRLKEESNNNIYKYREGFIQKLSPDRHHEVYLYTRIPVNPEKFCVKLNYLHQIKKK